MEEPEHPDETPAERLVEREVSEEALAHPAVASGALLSEILTFGETLERLLGVFVVILVGVLASRHFDPVGIPLALLLMLVIRPAAVFLGLIGTPTRPSQRVLMGWFGIRGIGSLYYLAYAIGEGIGPARAAQFSDLVVTTVAASILLHGTSVTPLLNIYEKALEKRAANKRKRVTLAP
jgi:NhaP-type Na+/H+ or K+/H+ antiporter